MGLSPASPQPARTGAMTTVAALATSAVILAANVRRKGATIVNDSTALMYIRLEAAAASASNYTVVLAGAAAAPFSYYELPYGYTGEVRALWASATGNARITELV